MSVTPVTPQTPSQLPPGSRPISESSRRTLGRLAAVSAVLTASLASLVIGIVIGYAARKRIHRMGHAG